MSHDNREQLHRKCQMCLRWFTAERPANNHKPSYCRDCADRRAAEKARVRMAKMRAKRRGLSIVPADPEGTTDGR